MNREVLLNGLYKNLNLLSEIPIAEWKIFEPLTQIKIVKKDEFFFREGDTDLSIGFLIKGLAHSFYTTADGKQFTKNFIWESRALGAWASILQSKSAQFSSQALEDSLVVLIKATDFERLQKNHICWQILSKKMTERLLIEREIREHDSLMLSNLERYEKFLVHFKLIIARIPQHMIASYLGISPVSLSRLLNNREK